MPFLFLKKVMKLRLDKFLKNSRIIKRRTIANEACDAGRVHVNGKTAKAGYEVKVGDVIEIRFGDKTIKFEITKIVENPRKDEALELYKALDS